MFHDEDIFNTYTFDRFWKIWLLSVWKRFDDTLNILKLFPIIMNLKINSLEKPFSRYFIFKIYYSNNEELRIIN